MNYFYEDFITAELLEIVDNAVWDYPEVITWT
jgi:hypothetical protein